MKFFTAVVICIALFTALYFALNNDYVMGAMFVIMAIVIYSDKDVK